MAKGILWAVPLQPIDVSPRFPNVPEVPHITLKFGATKQEWDHVLGCQFHAWVRGERWNDKIQALSIMLPLIVSIVCDNDNPHLTVSWENGAQPVESNDMLRGHHESIVLNKKITFEFGFYTFQEQKKWIN